jgi:hypothetical protein
MTDEESGIKIVSGRCSKDTRFYLGGKDVTAGLRVKSVSAEITADYFTKVTLEVYPSSLVFEEIEPKISLAEGSAVCLWCEFYSDELGQCNRLGVGVRKNFGCVDHKPKS